MENDNNLIQFDRFKAEITEFVKPVKGMTVKSQDDADKVIVLAKELKFWNKRVEDRRKELTAPHRQQIEKINSYAKEIIKPLDEAETHIKKELKGWEQMLALKRERELKAAQEERIRAEAEAKAKLEKQKKMLEMQSLFNKPEDVKREEVILQVETDRTSVELEQNHLATVKSIQSQKVDGARRVWTFEITDENLIPRDFLKIDETRIRAAIKAGEREIPGIRIFQDTQIAIR